MKTIQVEHTPTTFFLPADDLRAAFQCIGTEQVRYYLGGVLVEADKLIALDGHQMLTIDLPETAHVGEECFTQNQMPGDTGAGFILSCDATDKAFKAKGDLWIYGDVTTGILQFVTSDGQPGEHGRTGVLEFERIDGTYPDWRRVVAKGDGGAPSLCYDPARLSKLIKAAEVIDKGRAIRLTPGASEGDPIRVDFKASDRLRGTLMPMRWNKA
jgi:hypothetical protein